MGRDLEPRLASLLWSSTYADAIKVDLTIETNKGRHMFPFEKSFKILEYIFNPPENLGKVWKNVCKRFTVLGGKMQKPAEVRMLSWRVRYSRMVEQVHSIFAFGCERWFCGQQALQTHEKAWRQT